MKTEQALLSRKDDIIQRWMSRVQQDTLIESSCSLSYKEILDSLPDILQAIAHLLSDPDAEDAAKLLLKGLGHGRVRAKQGYNAAEIVREYALLREIVLDVLSEVMNRASPADIFARVGLINNAIDRVVAASMKRYADERLYDLNVLYDELINSNRELDRIIRNEQSNLAHLVHELKSPLSSITGYSELFLKQQKTKGTIHPEYIEQVLSSGRRLLKTIDSALEMSSYRSGKVALVAQPVDACEVIAEVCTALRIVAEKKGLFLSEQCDRNEIIIFTDKARLRQVITNILSNAIRYTESGSISVVTRLQEDSRIEIEITDTGYGIESTEQGLIFEPYYQGKAGQQLQSSTGLGLAITNQIIQLLQGSIRLRSQPQVGSTFTISLPLKLTSETETKPSVECDPRESEPQSTEAAQQSLALELAKKLRHEQRKL